MKILLINTQPLLGDRLMFTPVVRDLKAARPDWRIGVTSAGPEIWENNPHIDRAINETNCDKKFNIGPGKVTRGSKTNGKHITEAFRCSLQEHLGEQIKQGPFKPDIHLSEAEKNQRFIDGRYWLINCDTGPMTAKRWPLERFQQLVDSMKDLTFVQVGLARDCRGKLKGDNVIDMVNKTKVRELFSLVYNADGCISLVSSLMHVAAAFDKPCVVIAGGREPFSFERYANHRFIDSIGTLKCCKNNACWHNALSACKDHDGRFAKCMRLIEPPQVEAAVRSYYRGGAVSYPQPADRPQGAMLKPLLRIVAKGVMLGGAERSWTTIAKIFIEKNWRVEICPPEPLSPAVKAALPKEAVITNHLSRRCDVLLFYPSDLVFGFHESRFDVFNRIDAGRKVMALTYKIGKAGEVPWTKGWDKYLFLSSALRNGFLEKLHYAILRQCTEILAPCVDLEPFFKARPKYDQDGLIRIMRHSSQGDKKFPPDLAELMRKCDNGRTEFYLMPGPAGMDNRDNRRVCPWQSKPEGVADFLSYGNCYWYLLPDGYTDQGPRTIVEAMAAGLPVIAENRDGAKDRVTAETGWLVDSHDEAVEIIKSLTPEILAEKGSAARRRAQTEFVKDKWFDAIAG